MACPSFALTPSAISQLTDQVRSNGTFVHFLLDAHTEGCDVAPSFEAHLTVEQCGSDVAVQVRLGDSVNSITLPLAEDTSYKVGQFIEELAKTFVCSTGLEGVLRSAIREQNGRYLLPQSGVAGLGLVLKPAMADPRRTIFRFVLNGAGITLPMLLPADQFLAHELLTGCVHEIKGWQ